MKISDLETDPPEGSNDFLAKIRPLLDHFRATCKKLIKPGKEVSVDEQLIQCKARSKHTMNINAKAAGVGFKIYSLCCGNYLVDFRFASKCIGIEGIRKSRKKGDLPETGKVVVELVKALPKPLEYVVFVDNFFTRTNLLTHLKSLGIGACGTAKRGSGMPEVQVAIKEISKKSQDWGFRTVATTADIASLTWEDNNTVMLMTTAHTIDDLWRTVPFDPRRRKDIPETSYTNSPEGQKIQFPQPVVDYNEHMGGSDGCAQQRAMYSTDNHGDRRYWWKLFHFIVHQAALNSWILYKIDWPESKLNRREFQRLIGIGYTRNPAGQTRKLDYDFGNTNPKTSVPLHHWIHLSKKRTCTACQKAHRSRPVLQKIDGNIGRQRARAPQTSWGCSHPSCKGRYACRNQRCWEGIHEKRLIRSGRR